MTRLPNEFTKILLRHLPRVDSPALLTPSFSLIADGGLDSLETVGLVVDLEEGFDIRIPDEDLSGSMFATAQTVWAVVNRARLA